MVTWWMCHLPYGCVLVYVLYVRIVWTPIVSFNFVYVALHLDVRVCCTLSTPEIMHNSALSLTLKKETTATLFTKHYLHLNSRSELISTNSILWTQWRKDRKTDTPHCDVSILFLYGSWCQDLVEGKYRILYFTGRDTSPDWASLLFMREHHASYGDTAERRVGGWMGIGSTHTHTHTEEMRTGGIVCMWAIGEEQ